MERKKIKHEENKMKKGCFENSTKKILNGRWRYTKNSKKEEKKNFIKEKNKY